MMFSSQGVPPVARAPGKGNILDDKSAGRSTVPRGSDGGTHWVDRVPSRLRHTLCAMSDSCIQQGDGVGHPSLLSTRPPMWLKGVVIPGTSTNED